METDLFLELDCSFFDISTLEDGLINFGAFIIYFLLTYFILHINNINPGNLVKYLTF